MELIRLFLLAVNVFIGVSLFIWGFWIWKRYRRKPTAFSVVQIFMLLGVLFCWTWYIRVFPGSQAYYSKQYHEKITGYRFSGEKLLEFDPPRYGIGDGYSLYVHELDDETVQYFTNPDSTFFLNFPKISDSTSRWQCKTWSKSPLLEEEQFLLDFVLPDNVFVNSKEEEKLKEMLTYIRKIMKEKGHYYAIKYRLHGENIPANVSFFILSPKDKKLIDIYLDT